MLLLDCIAALFRRRKEESRHSKLPPSTVARCYEMPAEKLSREQAEQGQKKKSIQLHWLAQCEGLNEEELHQIPRSLHHLESHLAQLTLAKAKRSHWKKSDLDNRDRRSA